MKALVTGAGGFLGAHVVADLLRKGYEVNALVRPAAHPPLWGDRVQVFRTDLRAPSMLTEALREVDVVVHLAAATGGNEDAQFASTVVGTENHLAAVAQARIRRFVLVSSLVVYDWSKAGHTMDENTPLEGDIYSMGGYAIAKYWQERIVWRHAKSTGCELVVLRPGFIWGRGHTTIAGTGRQLGMFHLVIGPRSLLPLTHVENCAACVTHAAESPDMVGEAFNVTDNDRVSSWRYVGEYIMRSGRRGARVPVPYWLGSGVAALASLVSRWLFGKTGKLPSILTPRRFAAQFKPLHFSTEKMERVAGWTPPLSFAECLKRTYSPAATDALGN